MQTETKKSISSYVELYDAIQTKTGNVDVTIAILQEIGKDARMNRMSNSDSNGESLATEKQKDYLRDLGIEFDDSITKKEASELIEQSKSG